MWSTPDLNAEGSYDPRVGEREDEGPGQEVSFRVDVPEEERGGEYANFLAVWHTAHEFTLDFAATQPPQRADPEEENSPFVVLVTWSLGLESQCRSYSTCCAR
jgi:hypothetical protein